MVALNAVTAVLDLAVVALAFTPASAWGRRLPAVAVLLPAWVATGLLGPIAVTGRGRMTAVVAAWCGSAAAFSGGLWTAVTTLGTTDPAAAGNPASGLAELCCLLAGFALAVAGLLAVSGRGPGAVSDAGATPRAAARA